MRDMVSLPTPRGGSVKIVEQGNGTPVVFLHSGVGSAGEWREVFSLWPTGYRVIAVDAFRGGSGPGLPTHRTIDDFADQVHAVVGYVGQPIHLVGFSWGGATGLHMAATAPTALASLAVIEPEAYSLLEAEDGPAFTTLVNLRDRWRGHVQMGDWYAAFEEFIDFYNGRGSFAAWPAARRDAFLEDQRTRGDLWDVLFNAPITARSLASVATPVHVIEGSTTSIVDRAICQAVIRNVQNAKHSVIDGAGHMIPLSHPVDLTRVLVGQIA
jgi:pimeloyl-ACP methyl ester carboxylesterase